MSNQDLRHKRLVRGIAKGAGVVFIATIIARILGYVIRMSIARIYGPEGYGLVSTSLALFTIASTVALLGFTNSLTRQISYYLNTDRAERVKSLIFSAYGISSTLAIVAGTIIFIFSDQLAVNTFNNPKLTIFLKYFGASIFFFVWIKLAASIFKAYKRMIWYTLTQDVFRFGAILIAVLLVILLHQPVKSLGFAYFAAFLVVGVLGTVAAIYMTPVKKYPAESPFSEAPNLFAFSWPLMLASIIHMFLFRVDILMIGYFLNQTQVGIYNAAVPIGQLLTIIISSFTPFLLPTMTEYFAQNDIDNLNKTFAISTKWVFLFTIPAFSLMLFFPDFFLVVIFGKQFLEAALVLQIISAGFLLAASVGPTGNLLITVGKTHLNLINNLVVIVINIVLNLLLIPRFGIYGAAIASGFSYAFLNILALVEIYWMHGIQPYTPVYLRIGAIALLAGFGLSQLYDPERFWTGFILFIIYAGIYFAGLKLTGCFDPDDQIIFREFEKRYNRSLDWLKRLLR